MVIPSWVAHFYAVMAGLVLPTTMILLLPLKLVSIIYLVTSACFGFVSIWFGVETFAAMYLDSKKVSGDKCEPMNITYILPAYMDNEAAVLEETLKSYCNMVFNGNIRVLVVYNSKRDMSEIENKFDSEWNDYVHGNIRILSLIHI